MSINLVVFDIDQTVFNTTNALVKAFREVGVKKNIKLMPARIKTIEGNNLIESFQTFFDAVPNEQEFNEVLDSYVRYTKLWPGVHDLFERLEKQNFKIAVLTNNHSKIIDSLLKKYGLAKYIQKVYSIDNTDITTPAPSGLRMLMTELGVKPNNVVFLTKNPLDRKVGKKMGIRSIVIKRPEEEFIKLYQRLI